MWQALLTGLVILASTIQGSPHGARVLTSFDGREPGLVWYAVNDNVMGGRSRGGFEISQGKLVFSGEINTDGGGFASIRTAPRRLDVGMHSGVGFRARGDGRTYKFRLVTQAPDVSYMATFETRQDEWQDIELPFSAFVPSWRGRRLDGPPLEISDITSIGFMISDKQDGPFALEVDWITLSEGR